MTKKTYIQENEQLQEKVKRLIGKQLKTYIQENKQLKTYIQENEQLKRLIYIQENERLKDLYTIGK